ncbi:unnamed protein product, partial [Musa acuminata var. zebrina]
HKEKYIYLKYIYIYIISYHIISYHITACRIWKEPSGLALSSSSGRYSRRCAGKAAPPATVSRPAPASAALSPSSSPTRKRHASPSLHGLRDALRCATLHYDRRRLRADVAPPVAVACPLGGALLES